MSREGVEPRVAVGGAAAPARGAPPREAGRFPANHCLFALPLALGRRLRVGAVGEGAIKWRRGRSEAGSLASVSARLPEVKSGKDEGSPFPGWAGAGGACCFSGALRTPSAPLRGWEALALLGAGRVFVPEVMAAGRGGRIFPPPPLPPPPRRRAIGAPHPAEENRRLVGGLSGRELGRASPPSRGEGTGCVVGGWTVPLAPAPLGKGVAREASARALRGAGDPPLGRAGPTSCCRVGVGVRSHPQKGVPTLDGGRAVLPLLGEG